MKWYLQPLTKCAVFAGRTWRKGFWSFCLINFAILVILAATLTEAQSQREPRKVDFCDVVASPTNYYGQVLSVEVILWPSEHVLTLFGPECVPKEGYDITTQALLPANWEALPNGNKLRKILKYQRPAKVRVIGIFESREQRYGLDATRFRFSVSQLDSVSKYAAKKGGG
jgi:hypothetical protein